MKTHRRYTSLLALSGALVFGMAASHAGAVTLAERWNTLRAEYSFALFCAYPLYDGNGKALVTAARAEDPCIPPEPAPGPAPFRATVTPASRAYRRLRRIFPG